MKNIVVIGSSGHAKVIIDIVEKEKKYTIVGLLDKFKAKGEVVLGYKIIGSEDDLADLIAKHKLMSGIVAIGDNWQRKRVSDDITTKFKEFEFVSTVHPSAQIARDVKIGAGTVIMAGAIVNPGVIIGNHCIINTNAALDHDCVVKDFACVLPGAIVGGEVTIGEFSVVALGASVIHGVTIGTHSVVGAGAVVVKDVPDFSMVYGSPARLIKKRVAGDKYL